VKTVLLGSWVFCLKANVIQVQEFFECFNQSAHKKKHRAGRFGVSPGRVWDKLAVRDDDVVDIRNSPDNDVVNGVEGLDCRVAFARPGIDQGLMFSKQAVHPRKRHRG
jgi:hypothetical protein